MNEELSSVLTYLTAFLLSPTKYFINEAILVETNQRTKCPALESGELLQFIGIWMLITSNPGTKWAGYLSGNPIDFLMGDKLF